MTFPIFRKNEDIINKSRFGFGRFILLRQKKMSILKIYACLPFLKFILFDSFLGVGENLFYLIWSSIGIFFNSFGLI